MNKIYESQEILMPTGFVPVPREMDDSFYEILFPTGVGPGYASTDVASDTDILLPPLMDQ